MNCKERLKDYLKGYSSQYDFKDKNNIEHNLNDDIEEMLKENQKLEKALDDIEKYVIENSQYWDETGLRYWKNKKDEAHDILEIIKKAKRGNKYEKCKRIV